jgi:hypothetical protein
MATDHVVQPGFRNATDSMVINANIVNGVIAILSKKPNIVIKIYLNCKGWGHY